MSELRLVCLRLHDDTYYKWTYADTMLDSREMRKLRALAEAKGFRVDIERLDSIEDAERFLLQLPGVRTT